MTGTVGCNGSRVVRRTVRRHPELAHNRPSDDSPRGPESGTGETGHSGARNRDASQYCDRQDDGDTVTDRETARP